MSEKTGMKPMRDSFIFNNLNKDNSMLAIMQSAVKHDNVYRIRKGEQPEVVEEALINIQRSFKYLLKDNVMEALYNGDILLSYDPLTAAIPAMPFYLTVVNENGKKVLKAVVMLQLYAEKDRGSDYIRIDPKKLYTMMESALIALQYARAPRTFTNHTDTRSIGARIYSNMFVRVLNRKYSINSDKIVLQQVQFLAAKFYLVNILGMSADLDLTKAYAASAAVNHNEQIIDRLQQSTLNNDDFKNISNFVDVLVDPDLHLKFGDRLNTRSLVSDFVSMYDGTILLGVELLPYFLYNIFSAVQGAFVNNQYSLDNILEKDGVKLHNSISRILKDW